MKEVKTGPLFLFFIVASWGIEFGLGLFLLRLVWGSAWFPPGPGPHTSLAAALAQNANTIVNNNTYYLTGKHRVLLNWTPNGVLVVFMWLFVLAHVVNAVWFGFLEPSLRLRKLGARRPSAREREAFDRAVEQLSRAYGRPISTPRVYRSVDGLNLQTRWIGNVLLIDRKLYTHRNFLPLLAHELGNTNSEDRIAHRLYAMLPRPAAVVGTLGGFPFGIGHVLLYPAWLWYWRRRVYAADSFAYDAGQGIALEQVLDRFYIHLDRPTAWGREWQRTPYVEQRIDHLRALRNP